MEGGEGFKRTGSLPKKREAAWRGKGGGERLKRWNKKSGKLKLESLSSSEEDGKSAEGRAPEEEGNYFGQHTLSNNLARTEVKFWQRTDKFTKRRRGVNGQTTRRKRSDSRQSRTTNTGEDWRRRRDTCGCRR